mmetsp:Transcript_81458/g.225620  ORF Transcript_81458/g.225620 Transcript_81458/m.225620 type:complete len:203 (-) Transcript_81458:673-1281(-)
MRRRTRACTTIAECWSTARPSSTTPMQSRPKTDGRPRTSLFRCWECASTWPAAPRPVSPRSAPVVIGLGRTACSASAPSGAAAGSSLSPGLSWAQLPFSPSAAGCCSVTAPDWTVVGLAAPPPSHARCSENLSLSPGSTMTQSARLSSVLSWIRSPGCAGTALPLAASSAPLAETSAPGAGTARNSSASHCRCSSWQVPPSA